MSTMLDQDEVNNLKDKTERKQTIVQHGIEEIYKLGLTQKANFPKFHAQGKNTWDWIVTFLMITRRSSGFSNQTVICIMRDTKKHFMLLEKY